MPLQLWHFKNDSIQEKNSNFEIAALSRHLNGKGKSEAISRLELFLTEWSRSYIVFAL